MTDMTDGTITRTARANEGMTFEQFSAAHHAHLLRWRLQPWMLFLAALAGFALGQAV